MRETEGGGVGAGGGHEDAHAAGADERADLEELGADGAAGGAGEAVRGLPSGCGGEVRELAPSARFADAFLLQCDQERANLDALRGWA
jgi:hypothetical protein